MTIFRLNFLLKVAHILVCQNPSFISTLGFYPDSKVSTTLYIILNSTTGKHCLIAFI